MTESELLLDLFGNLYDGHPWIDVTLVGVLENIPAEKAQKRVLNNCNTIWEIVNHLIQWRKNVLQRVQGITLKTPGNNYFEHVQDTSETAWKNTLSELADTQSNGWISCNN